MLTAVGRIPLTRSYVIAAEGGQFTADLVLGVDGYLTAGAQRMATLAGLQQSFAKAEQLLAELSGWELDDESIRRLTHSAAKAALQQRAQRKDRERFATAAGAIEVPIDAGKVNTTEGWRDVKMAVFSKREAGPAATPSDYAERELPAPTIRTVIAEIAPVEMFAERVQQEAERLTIITAPDITVLADGAEWILLHEGAIEVCGASKICRTIENPCNAVGLTPSGQVGEPGGWLTRTGTSKLDFDTAFPFVKSPPLVDFKFYHTRAEVEANQCPRTTTEPRTQRADAESPVDPLPVYVPASPLRQVQTAQSEESPAQQGPAEPIGQAEVPPLAPILPLDNGPPVGISIYAGAQGGRGWKDSSETSIACDDPGNYFDQPGGSCAEPGAQQLYEFETRGFTGGAYAGVNFRAGMVVIGAEADFSLANIDSEQPFNANGVAFRIGGSNISENINWMGTVRGRAGLTLGNLLVFGTGGLAFADVDFAFDLNSNFGPLVTGTAQSSATKTGWTAGGGFEVSFGLWTLKSEYLYYDLGTETLESEVFFSGTSTGETVDTGISLSPEFETTGHIVRTGLSFRLN